MSRLVPRPMLSLTLFIVWLLLGGSLAATQIALAVLMAWAIPLTLRQQQPGARWVGKPTTVLRLASMVAWDILVASVVVARLVLGPMHRLRPAFVLVPLDTRHPYAITLLASIITMVPGAVSVDVDEARGRLLVHALDVDDTARLVARIKQRYEVPLKEIFGC